MDNRFTRLLQFLVVDIWPITWVSLLGFAAIFFLLPRPKGRSRILGGLCAASAVLLGVLFVVPATGLSSEAVLFYAFGGIAILSGGVMVTQSKPARAAMAFAMVVLSSCGIFLLQAAPFLMVATTIIYAGAIIVTFLFVLMLASQAGPSDADQRSREPEMVTGTAFVLMGMMLYVLHISYGTAGIDALIARLGQAQSQETVAAMASILGDEDEGNTIFFQNFEKAILREQEKSEVTTGTPVHWITDEVANVRGAWTEAIVKKDLEKARGALERLEGLGRLARATAGQLQPGSDRPLSALSGPPANTQLFATPGEEGKVPLLRRDPGTLTPEMPAENVAHLGRSLFTDNLLAVELAGTLLLVATIGAIIIAGRREEKNS